MLSSLIIHNIILIEKATITFEKGFSAFTGETGAGKSILFGAIGLILGERATPYLLRSGTETASVTALFTGWQHPVIEDLLKKEDISLQRDEDLIIRRTLHLDGKSRLFLNDTPVTMQLVRDMAPYLIDIHGQFDRYLTPKDHLLLIDLYGNTKTDIKNTAKIYSELTALKEHRTNLLDAKHKAGEQLSYLKNALEEITTINPEEGEHDTLLFKRKQYLDREKHYTVIESVKSILQEEEGLSVLLRSALKQLSKLPEDLPHLKEVLIAFESAEEKAHEADTAFNQLLHAFEETQDLSIEELEKRLFTLRGLAHKHHIPVHELHLLKEKLKEEIHTLENMEMSLTQIETSILRLKEDYKESSKKLSLKRQKAATDFIIEVTKLLPALKLENARFDISHRVYDEDAWRSDGVDQIEFIISMNKGSPLAPLARIASGGELSRLMLAFKYVLSACYETPTLLFDEVDAGMGGAVAAAVGKLLQTISQHKQVLAVTHAPQVASFAEEHYAIAKTIENHHTKTTINHLTEKDRIEELARMLSGENITDVSRRAATDMLKTHSS